jgi:hypothetical protein
MKKLKSYLRAATIMMLLFCVFSCSTATKCPTITKNYFMRGVPKPKPIYSSKKRKVNSYYIVPQKYRRETLGYGDILKSKR